MAIRIGDPVYQFDAYSVALNAPAASGVYAICNQQSTYIYFGESNDIRRRLYEHLADRTHAMHTHGAASFAFDMIDGEVPRILRQNELIRAHPTPCNQRFG
jgi:excinuclease UvrABC nuclease subunit